MLVLLLLLSTNHVDARRPLYRSKAKSRQLKANEQAKNECRLYNKPSVEICEQKNSKLKTIEMQQKITDYMLVLPIFIIGIIGLIRNI